MTLCTELNEEALLSNVFAFRCATLEQRRGHQLMPSNSAKPVAGYFRDFRSGGA